MCAIFSWSFWLISKIYIIFSEIMYKNCILLTYKRICILCWTILLLHPLLCMEMWEWKFDMSGLISLQFSADGYSTYIWLSTYFIKMSSTYHLKSGCKVAQCLVLSSTESLPVVAQGCILRSRPALFFNAFHSISD